MEKQVVARFVDGRLCKGTTEDFSPGSSALTVRISEGPLSGEKVSIKLSELKALFFVRSLGGNPQYSEKKLQSPQNLPGENVTVTFIDGETIRGTAMGRNLGLSGFYLFPADLHSNNKRIFIVRSSVRNIKVGK